MGDARGCERPERGRQRAGHPPANGSASASAGGRLTDALLGQRPEQERGSDAHQAASTPCDQGSGRWPARVSQRMSGNTGSVNPSPADRKRDSLGDTGLTAAPRNKAPVLVGYEQQRRATPVALPPEPQWDVDRMRGKWSHGDAPRVKVRPVPPPAQTQIPARSAWPVKLEPSEPRWQEDEAEAGAAPEVLNPGGRAIAFGSQGRRLMQRLGATPQAAARSSGGSGIKCRAAKPAAEAAPLCPPYQPLSQVLNGDMRPSARQHVPNQPAPSRVRAGSSAAGSAAGAGASRAGAGDNLGGLPRSGALSLPSGPAGGSEAAAAAGLSGRGAAAARLAAQPAPLAATARGHTAQAAASSGLLGGSDCEAGGGGAGGVKRGACSSEVGGSEAGGSGAGGPAGACPVCGARPQAVPWKARCGHSACRACWKRHLAAVHACPVCERGTHLRHLAQNYFASA